MKNLNAIEPLTIACNSLAVAEHMASLVEGYCRLVARDPVMSVWTRPGKSTFRVFEIIVLILFLINTRKAERPEIPPPTITTWNFAIFLCVSLSLRSKWTVLLL